MDKGTIALILVGGYLYLESQKKQVITPNPPPSPPPVPPQQNRTDTQAIADTVGAGITTIGKLLGQVFGGKSGTSTDNGTPTSGNTSQTVGSDGKMYIMV